MTKRFQARITLLVEGDQVDDESVDDFVDSSEAVFRECLDARKMKYSYLTELVPDSITADRGREVERRDAVVPLKV